MYMGFGTILGFRHPLGGLGMDRGRGLLYRREVGSRRVPEKAN